MTYRFPIRVGDRVALAPHTDYWMSGVRFGVVTSVGGEGSMDGRFYFIDLDTGRNITLNEVDLLGAVGEPRKPEPPVREDEAQAVREAALKAQDGTVFEQRDNLTKALALALDMLGISVEGINVEDD